MVVLVGAVLAVSLWTLRRADRAAMRELSEAETRLAHDTATSLDGYLTSFDRDARLLAVLATTTRKLPIEEQAQDAAILDAFQALATVVPHYRTIALFRQLWRKPTVTGDPTMAPGTGQTWWFGDVEYSTAGSATEQELARVHELVHSFLRPRLRFLRQFRARLNASAY